MATTFTVKDVGHIAKLANIPVTEKEKEELAPGFTKTIAVVDTLNSLDVSGIPSTHMTGLKNVFREDIVDTGRMFTQDQALSNAVKTDNGYIVVNQIIDQEE
jgi:aspartyl-tRNA(Asn)/glutamyl-tRNA(Gln) amidotransferase subunit C